MTTMNISLPENLKNFVDTQVQQRGYSTSSEYVRELIRNDQIRQVELRLATMMQNGLESGTVIPVEVTYWNEKYDTLKQRHLAQ